MICENCKKEYVTSYGSGRFCSELCARGFSTKNEANYEKEASCKKCGKSFMVNKRAAASNVLCPNCRLKSKPHKQKDSPQRCCKMCGKTELRGRSQFCSKLCISQYRWQARCLQIHAAGEFKYGLTNNAIPKRYMIHTSGHRCMICGQTEWMGKPVPLVLDHIDGNSDNYKLSNLQLVCGNCDMQLPTYKSKNKNSGNTSRSKRRREYWRKQSQLQNEGDFKHSK